MIRNRSMGSWILFVLVRILLVGYTIAVLYPIIWATLMSLKPNSQFFQDIWALPKTIDLDNYVRAWNTSNVGSYFFNSIFVTIITTVVILVTCIPLSYTLGRFRFRGRGIIKAIIVSGLLFPSMTGLISQYIMLLRAGIGDTYFGLVLIYLAVSIAFTVFMMTNFFASVPVEFEESARIDGCGYWRTLWRIVVPMVRSGVVMVTILNVLSVWNEYTIALTVISTPSKRTIAVGVTSMLKSQTEYTDWGALFAALVILMFMSFLIYAIFQRQITDNVTIGGVK